MKKVEGRHGFEVGKSGRWYVVQMPHQCEEFTAACGLDREAAISEMEAFVEEAQAALELLKALGEEP